LQLGGGNWPELDMLDSLTAEIEQAGAPAPIAPERTMA
jgi:hypothetical protein